MLVIRAMEGARLIASLDEVARLRIEVFRDWPYLYDGDLAYERRYLARFRGNDRALIVGAYHSGTLVGASTAMPLTGHADDFAAAFAGTGYDPDTVYYCAESVLRREYRGQGAGRAFFEFRENHARDLGFAHVCFCAVIRPGDHPMRPPGYVPLDRFWRGLGYQPLPGAVARFSWKDVGSSAETEKPLQFWIRAL